MSSDTIFVLVWSIVLGYLITGFIVYCALEPKNAWARLLFYGLAPITSICLVVYVITLQALKGVKALYRDFPSLPKRRRLTLVSTTASRTVRLTKPSDKSYVQWLVEK